MISVYKLFEGFTKGGRWIPYPNSVGSIAKKRPMKVLDPDQSQTRYLPFKKIYSQVTDKKGPKLKMGGPGKTFKYNRSNLPSYPKRYM